MESINEQVDKVKEAFDKLLNPQPEMPEMPEVEEIYPDHIIACVDGKYYKIKYKAGADGMPVFSAREQWVEVEETYKPVKNILKAVSSDDNELRVGNYIVLFGGRDLSGFGFIGNKTPKFRNADGTAGEFFSKSVVLDSDYTELGKIPVNWEHGQDPDGLGVDEDEILGYVDWKTARVDDKGVFVERVLNRRKSYVQWIEELILAGLVGTSSEAVGKGVKIQPNGEIVKWPLKKDTLTVMPAEPRMLVGENVLNAYKALGLYKEVTPPEGDLQVTEAQAEQDKPEAAVVPDTIQTKSIGVIKMEIDDVKLQEMLSQAAEAGATKAIAATEPVKSVGTIQVTEAAEDRPFKSIAENLLAVKVDVLSHGNSDNQYPRMRFLKATGASEGVPSDGGFLLDPTLTNEIIQPMHEAGPFSNSVRRLPVGANSNYGWLNAVDETSRATGSRWGGIRGYRLAEAATKTASKPTFRRINWELKKYAAVVVATDELLADAPMFSEIVRTGVAEELNFMLNDDIMNGLGVAGPLGFMQSGSLISVTRDTGSKILGNDISAMWSRMDLRGRNTANWYISNDSAGQLDALFAVGSTAVLFPYAGYTSEGVRTLYGRPVITSEFNATLNTTGDIVLADMNQYLLWEKGGVQAESSIHVYFLSDETAFRFVYRVDGQPSVASALTPYKGSTTTSPFVVLGSAT